MGEAAQTPAAIPMPSAKPIKISSDITLQPPLSRRGRGPGLILVLDRYAHRGKSDKTLDPPPLQKWAEEGYAVAEIRIPGKTTEFPLAQAIEALKKLPECESENGFGLISYLIAVPFYVEEATCGSDNIEAIISYGGRRFGSIDPDSLSEPQLLHLAGPAPSSSDEERLELTGEVKRYFYDDVKARSSWFLPADPDYHPSATAMAHTRCLSFLKPMLKGPYFDLEAIWEEHTLYEFVERDVEKTMATMVAEPYVNHIPTMTGGIGRAALTSFYTNHFIHSNPPTTRLSPISRTIGIDRIVDEFLFKCTHSTTIPWLLPNIPPTGRELSVPMIGIINIRGDRLFHEHISWDQGTVLSQLGLMPLWLRFPYRIEGKEGEGWEVRAPVAGVETASKLESEGKVESNGLIEREDWLRRV